MPFIYYEEFSQEICKYCRPGMRVRCDAAVGGSIITRVQTI